MAKKLPFPRKLFKKTKIIWILIYKHNKFSAFISNKWYTMQISSKTTASATTNFNLSHACGCTRTHPRGYVLAHMHAHTRTHTWVCTHWNWERERERTHFTNLLTTSNINFLYTLLTLLLISLYIISCDYSVLIIHVKYMSLLSPFMTNLK